MAKTIREIADELGVSKTALTLPMPKGRGVSTEMWRGTPRTHRWSKNIGELDTRRPRLAGGVHGDLRGGAG